MYPSSSISRTAGATTVWKANDDAMWCICPDCGWLIQLASLRLPMKNSAEGKNNFCAPQSSTTRQKALMESWIACFSGQRATVDRRPLAQLVTVMLRLKALAAT